MRVLRLMKQLRPAASLVRGDGLHLVACEQFVYPGEEWRIQVRGWCLMQVKDGNGYCRPHRDYVELEIGSVILRSDAAPASILASQVRGMKLNYFRLQPELLGGLAM